MTVIETRRLDLRRLAMDDAPFIVRLLTGESFVRFIGDKGVRTLEDARVYIASGPVTSYTRFGFGLYLVEKHSGDGAVAGVAAAEPIGICGLVKREVLEDPDLGFAFLPEFWSCGYAAEAAAGVLGYAVGTLGLPRVVAVTDPDNLRSIHLLEKLGFRYRSLTRLSPAGADLKLFVFDTISPR